MKTFVNVSGRRVYPKDHLMIRLLARSNDRRLIESASLRSKRNLRAECHPRGLSLCSAMREESASGTCFKAACPDSSLATLGASHCGHKKTQHERTRLGQQYHSCLVTAARLAPFRHTPYEDRGPIGTKARWRDGLSAHPATVPGLWARGFLDTCRGLFACFLGSLSEAVLKPLGVRLGASWGLFWVSAWPLGASWALLGASLMPSGGLGAEAVEYMGGALEMDDDE